MYLVSVSVKIDFGFNHARQGHLVSSIDNELLILALSTDVIIH